MNNFVARLLLRTIPGTGFFVVTAVRAARSLTVFFAGVSYMKQKQSMMRVLALAALALYVASAAAQSFPSRPVVVVVASAAGGGHDFTARVIAEKLGELLGRQVLVENRGGGSASIGTEYVARAVPDGHTFLVSSPSGAVINAYTMKLRYSPIQDLAPVTLAGMTPLVLVGHPTLPARNLNEVIALAKRRPGELAYGTAGATSNQALAGAWLSNLAVIKLNMIPYKGAGPAALDAMSGHIPLAVVGMAPVITHIKSKRLNAIAVMNAKRVGWLPDVPAAAESPGLRDFEVVHWMGVQVPTKTPPEIVNLLNREIAKVVHMPDVSQKLMNQGIAPVGNSVDEFGAFLKNEDSKYARLVKLSNINEN